MRKAFKYRLYPNQAQTEALAVMLETHRRLYNQCLYFREMAWELYRTPLTFREQRIWFNRQQHLGHPWYGRLNNNSAHATIDRLEKAFEAFFRRVKAGETPGYPRYRGRDRFDTIEYGTYPNGLRLFPEQGKARVQHVGLVRVKQHRPTEGKIKRALLKCEAGRWFLILSCDLGEVTVPPSTLPAVGIDMGLASFLTTSTGEKEPNPRHLQQCLKELRRLQRSLCRKKKGGSNRRKQRLRVARLHARVANLRKEQHHRLANRLVARYGLIAVERLNIRGLGASRLARSVLDAGWGSFLLILQQKAAAVGVQVVEVDPRGTSQECSQCGQLVLKDLSVRVHACPHCGLTMDRDENAARVILARALARLGPAAANGEVAPRPQRSTAASGIQAPRRKPAQRGGRKQGSLKTAAETAEGKAGCDGGVPEVA